MSKFWVIWCLIGLGFSAWSNADELTPEERAYVNCILEAQRQYRADLQQCYEIIGFDEDRLDDLLDCTGLALTAYQSRAGRCGPRPERPTDAPAPRRYIPRRMTSPGESPYGYDMNPL
ncbi:MAG: hypothetical protein AB7P04_05315 [Bacteriovoracia bacterium]